MYPKSQIHPFCLECHPKGQLNQDENHKGLFAEPPSAEEVCTDCHATKHRLEVRTRRWDKQTGKLIWDDGVRMMETKPAGGDTR